MLNGIDISSWQASIRLDKIKADFVIVKATGGTGYTNPRFKDQADAALKAGKLLGLYHYARERGCSGSAASEAAHFLDAVAPYKGKFIPILDWEADALQQPVSWAKTWLDTVAKKTGATPWFYGYASNVNSTDYSAIKNYPLWMASYLNRYAYQGYADNPVNTWKTGAWSKMTAYQYSSTGRLPGYSGNLDLSVFYGDKADWERMCGKKQPKITWFDAKKPYIVLVDNLRVREEPSRKGKVLAHYGKKDIVWGMDGTVRNDKIIWGTYVADSGIRRYIAIKTVDNKTRWMRPATKKEQEAAKKPKASRIEKMCREAEGIAADDRHGYSQAYRWPAQGSDFDCSSLMYWCANKAGYAVTLGPAGVHYTGSMLADFKKAGFTALPFSSVGLKGLKRGDILLNVANHTEMCIGNGKFVGAHSSETGGIYGQQGDQTGSEISVCNAYNYPWDWVLRPPSE